MDGLAALLALLGITESSTSTPAVAPTLGSVSEFSLHKVGKRVEFHLKYANSTLANGYTADAAIIPAEYRPAFGRIALAVFISTDPTIAKAFANSGGGVGIRVDSAYTGDIQLDGSWITA